MNDKWKIFKIDASSLTFSSGFNYPCYQGQDMNQALSRDYRLISAIPIINGNYVVFIFEKINEQ